MKKLFSSLLLAVVVMTGFAQVKQDTFQHLTFKGVPIDGTLDDYVSKMKQGGFTLIQTEDGTAILNGDFAGYKDCNIGVSTLKQKDLVHKIVVIFPEKDTWSTLSGNYFDLKQLLTEKYGKPSEIVEKFDGYSEPIVDDRKMHEVKFDNCKYYSKWETDKGEIKLSIAHTSVTSCFVTLAYFDKINGDKIKAKAKDDL
jgi:hypothetical protein